MSDKEVLITADHLKVYFAVKGGIPFKRKYVHAVDDVTLSIERGEAFGLVGESGCGKSTLANAMLGMVRPTDGKVFLNGRDLYSLSRKELKLARRNVQMIFQDPFSSLNPRFNVYEIISEPMRIRGDFTQEQIRSRVTELLGMVGLSENDIDRYPGDFSGGQRQRIGIARAISLNPDFLVCDEPVSALDVSVHAQILNLLMDLQKQLSMTYLFISHNLAVVRDVCRHVAVMYLGQIVEMGETEEIFTDPLHPYTQSLLSAVLTLDTPDDREPVILKGELPSPIDLPHGCRFASRCPYASDICRQEEPALVDTDNRSVRCHKVRNNKR